MKTLIEIDENDYQYCLDYARGNTNILALNNVNKIIKAVANGTLQADCEARTKIGLVSINNSDDHMTCSEIIQQKINKLKGEDDNGN